MIGENVYVFSFLFLILAGLDFFNDVKYHDFPDYVKLKAF